MASVLIPGGSSAAAPAKQSPATSLKSRLNSAAGVIGDFQKLQGVTTSPSQPGWLGKLGLVTAVGTLLKPLAESAMTLIGKNTARNLTRESQNHAQRMQMSEHFNARVPTPEKRARAKPPSRSFAPNATLCSEGECLEVDFKADKAGHLVGHTKGGTALVSCHSEPSGKRSCEWKGKKWTEK